MHIVIAGLLIAVMIAIWWNNHHIIVTEYQYDRAVPSSLNRYRIVQLSDIHGDLPLWKRKRILQMTQMQNPDMVVVKGDCIDHIHIRQKQKVLALLVELHQQYPLYLVSGNHEYMHKDCEAFLHEIEQAGIRVLHDEWVEVRIGNDMLRLWGMKDPYALYQGKVPKKYTTPREQFVEHIQKCRPAESNDDNLTVLLSHRPEFLELYATLGVDIVLTGHAHGGQWRLPFYGPMIAPDQGLRPAYIAGAYTQGTTTMLVSRGLGNSVVPFRLFNLPEIVVVTFCAV